LDQRSQLGIEGRRALRGQQVKADGAEAHNAAAPHNALSADGVKHIIIENVAAKLGVPTTEDVAGIKLRRTADDLQCDIAWLVTVHDNAAFTMRPRACQSVLGNFWHEFTNFSDSPERKAKAPLVTSSAKHDPHIPPRRQLRCVRAQGGGQGTQVTARRVRGGWQKEELPRYLPCTRTYCSCTLTLRYTPLQCIILYYSVLHCTTLHFTTLY